MCSVSMYVCVSTIYNKNPVNSIIDSFKIDDFSWWLHTLNKMWFRFEGPLTLHYRVHCVSSCRKMWCVHWHCTNAPLSSVGRDMNYIARTSQYYERVSHPLTFEETGCFPYVAQRSRAMWSRSRLNMYSFRITRASHPYTRYINCVAICLYVVNAIKIVGINTNNSL